MRTHLTATKHHLPCAITVLAATWHGWMRQISHLDASQTGWGIEEVEG